jgi:ribosome recycling factor
MGPQSVDILTTAVAPIVMVSAAGLLFNGVQAKNLHLSDRIRGLMVEVRNPATTPDRRQQVVAQLAYFDRRMRLSQHALELI